MEPLTLTNSEWYVLDSLWERSPMTVMELVSALHEKVGWAKSTTITTLRRMEGQGPAPLSGGRPHQALHSGGGAAERRPAGDPLLPGPGVPRQCGIDGLLPWSGTKPWSREDLDQLYEILRQAEGGNHMTGPTMLPSLMPTPDPLGHHLSSADPGGTGCTAAHPGPAVLCEPLCSVAGGADPAAGPHSAPLPVPPWGQWTLRLRWRTPRYTPSPPATQMCRSVIFSISGKDRERPRS